MVDTHQYVQLLNFSGCGNTGACVCVSAQPGPAHQEAGKTWDWVHCCWTCFGCCWTWRGGLLHSCMLECVCLCRQRACTCVACAVSCHAAPPDAAPYCCCCPLLPPPPATPAAAAVNANHPVVKQLIIDSLVHWVEEYHVDGFRFDLASCLCRGRVYKDQRGKGAGGRGLRAHTHICAPQGAHVVVKSLVFG